MVRPVARLRHALVPSRRSWRRSADVRGCRGTQSWGQLRGASDVAPAWTAAWGDRNGDDAQVLTLDMKNRFGRMGTLSHKKVSVRDLYRIFKAARSPEDYKASLAAMNTFYNFGVKLHHRELATRLLATAMVCKQADEAVELVKLSGSWLEHPPESTLVYALMGHFLDAGEPLVVRELAKAVREDWRMRVEPPLYVLAIEAMLGLPEESSPLAEATALRDDARAMGVRLPAPVHVRLINEHMAAFEAAVVGESDNGAAADASEETGTEAEGDAADPGGPDEAAAPKGDSGAASMPSMPSDAALCLLQGAFRAADALAADGHLHGGANAATCCSVAWLFWRLDTLPDQARAAVSACGSSGGSVLHFVGGSWVRALEAAVQNFGCHWGFSAKLPRGLFKALESSTCPEAARLVAASQRRFGRFYPKEITS